LSSLRVCSRSASRSRETRDPHEGADFWFYGGVALLSAGAFRLTAARTERRRPPWVTGLATVLIAGFGLSILAVFRWVDACAN
jgi:hypothetical protein